MGPPRRGNPSLQRTMRGAFIIACVLLCAAATGTPEEQARVADMMGESLVGHSHAALVVGDTVNKEIEGSIKSEFSEPAVVSDEEPNGLEVLEEVANGKTVSKAKAVVSKIMKSLLSKAKAGVSAVRKVAKKVKSKASKKAAKAKKAAKVVAKMLAKRLFGDKKEKKKSKKKVAKALRKSVAPLFKKKKYVHIYSAHEKERAKKKAHAKKNKKKAGGLVAK